jgi:spermidine synthase
MVRVMNHHCPDLRLDVVELDAAMVAVARDFFGVTAGPRTRIFVADGREYLERTTERYDIILIDAHLHPGERTDATGHPLSLKNDEFYASIYRRLNAGGVVMFNILTGPDSQRYLDSIRRAFPASHVYHPRATGNLVVFASPQAPLASDVELRQRAREFDRRDAFGFSFERILDDRERDSG